MAESRTDWQFDQHDFPPDSVGVSSTCVLTRHFADLLTCLSACLTDWLIDWLAWSNQLKYLCARSGS